MAGTRTIGIVGYGYIGSYVYQQFNTRPELGVEVVFVHDQDSARLAELPEEVILENLDHFASRGADMICEFAHPDVTRRYGEFLISEADYLPLSVTAFADAEVERRMRQAAEANGTRLYIPHGGVMGLDSIIEGRDDWEEIRFVMEKNPRNIDFAVSGYDPTDITERTVVYDGPTRDLCPEYPRNVNTHATLALAGIGFDRTRSILVADPALDTSVLEIYARGGGQELTLRRTSAIKGVTGISTLNSVMNSVTKTARASPGLQFC